MKILLENYENVTISRDNNLFVIEAKDVTIRIEYEEMIRAIQALMEDNKWITSPKSQ